MVKAEINGYILVADAFHNAFVYCFMVGMKTIQKEKNFQLTFNIGVLDEKANFILRNDNSFFF